MLEVKNLNAYYGKSHILQGVTLNINREKLYLYLVETEWEDLLLSKA